MTETIGARIKRERVARLMSQRDLADLVGVGFPHISKVEAGRESPGEPLLRKIAATFNLNPDELFLLARRLPDEIVDLLAANPAKTIRFLRTLRANRR